MKITVLKFENTLTWIKELQIKNINKNRIEFNIKLVDHLINSEIQCDIIIRLKVFD